MEGDVIGRMRLDIADVQHKLGRVEAMMKKSMASIEKKSAMTSQAMAKDTKNFMHVSRDAARTFSLDWWKRFGEVAVGFTIAYRAMMAAEAAIRGVIQSFKIGLDAIDEFNMGVISIAASLQMLTKVPSQESLEAYLKFGEIMFKKMEILAIRHFATGEQLQMAFTKMVTLGIVPHTEAQLEAMAALVDRILMATKGLDAGRQIVTETQAAIEGMMRPGAIVAKELASLVENYKDLIKEKDKEHVIIKKTAIFLEGIAKPLEAVSSVSDEIMKTMQAWIASIKTAGTIMLRAGLDKMYIDIVGALKDIVGYLIDKNGLTEEGIKLAYLYYASWESVKTAMGRVRDVGVTIGALYKTFTFNIPILSNFLWALSSGVMALKYGLKSVIIMIDEIKESFSMPGVEPFKDYFEEAFAELDKPTGSLLEYAKVNIQAWNKMYWAMSEASKKAHNDINDSAGTMLERIGKKQEQLVIDWNAELMKMKLPHEWLDPKEFEEFAEKIRKTQSELTGEILAMLAKLRKGTGEEDEKALKARLRKERQLLTFMSQMQKDYLVGNFVRFKANADAEYEIRLIKILEIVTLEKRCLFEVAAKKAYYAKVDLHMLNMLKHHTKNYYAWKKTEIEKDTEAMIAAGSKRADAESWALDELKDLNIAHNQFILEHTESLAEAMDAAWANWILKSKSVVQKVAEASVELMKDFARGVGDAFAQAIVYGEDLVENLQDLARRLAATIISTLIEIGTTALMQNLMGLVVGSGPGAGAGLGASLGAPGTGPGTVEYSVVGSSTGAYTLGSGAGAYALGSGAGAFPHLSGLKSYDEGGISTIPGIYYAGVPEVHIPLDKASTSKFGDRTINVPINIDGFGDKRMTSELKSEIESTVIKVLQRHS